jgi:hypothetical protein
MSFQWKKLDRKRNCAVFSNFAEKVPLLVWLVEPMQRLSPCLNDAKGTMISTDSREQKRELSPSLH